MGFNGGGSEQNSSIDLYHANVGCINVMAFSIKFLKRSEENSQEFEKFFWSGGDLARLYDSLGTNGKDMTGLAEIFRSGYKEYLSQKEHKSFDDLVKEIGRAHV